MSHPFSGDLGHGVINTWKKDIEIEVPWDEHEKKLKAKGWIGIRLPEVREMPVLCCFEEETIRRWPGRWI